MTMPQPLHRKRTRALSAHTIDLSHGSGGTAMRDLISDVFLPALDTGCISKMEDSAVLQLSDFSQATGRIAITTDSYVVAPLFFPGGDIGSMAVHGTVNDLAVVGATPLFLTCAVIIEEGFATAELRRIVQSMRNAAELSGVRFVAGDTKVVERGSADKIFINTTGIGVIPDHLELGTHLIRPGDVVITSGYIGDHGAAIAVARGDLCLENDIKSDSRPLNKLTDTMLKTCPQIRCMRDTTRGGIATVLNEFAGDSSICIKLEEPSIPIRPQVRGLCEILGLDPLYLANEGNLVCVVPEKAADQLVARMRMNEAGLNARVIGQVAEFPQSTVILKTVFGGERIVDTLVGDQLPRIC